ncbi:MULTISPECIES: hypothetical protein [Pantoea]|jgi:hypothetical protein|uniref:hypothetical protein n=1 Tax=Pantoea TaxID=53335 RepID=UPI0008FD3056|nr:MULTISPECIES: hypothetical protein [Pantoea]MCL9646448.1 hypothetical protein [Pantoea eucrina]MDJ0022300.1 hypothetical protein [Pantoea eucrina]
MKYLWKPLLSCPEKTEIRFPRLFTIAAGIVALIVMLMFSALTLENAQLTLSMLIWRLLALPVAVCMAVVSLCFVVFHLFCCWRLLMQLAYSGVESDWQSRASEWMLLAEHTSIFPVDNAALKMLGLEGNMPVDGDIPLRLSVGDDERSGMGRMLVIVQRLLEQLDLTQIDAITERPELFLYMGNTTEAVRNDIKSLAQSFHAAFRHASFHYFDDMPELSLTQQWTSGSSFNGFRLLLIAELHDGDNRNFCEYACALLFSRYRKISGNRVPVCCFQGMSARIYNLERRINTLLSAGQARPADLRHVWTSDLRGESLYVLKNSLQENHAGINVRSWQNMRIAHTWTAGYQWLMMDWAAMAVRHGERAQLLAAREMRDEQITFLQMNGEPARPEDNYSPVYIKSLKKSGSLVGCSFVLGTSLLLMTISIEAGWSLEKDFVTRSAVFIMPAMLTLLSIGFMLGKSYKKETELASYYDYE